MKLSRGGGYGVLGIGTEWNFVIEDDAKRDKLKREMVDVATGELFLRHAGFEQGAISKPPDPPLEQLPVSDATGNAGIEAISKPPEPTLEQWFSDLLSKLPRGSAEWRFYDLLHRTEVVGSGRGGAAGNLKIAGEEGYRLRLAIQPEGSYGFFKRYTILKHELGHFVREAKVQGRWWLRWRLGTVVTAAVLVGGLVVLAPLWVVVLALFVPVMWFLESKSLFEQERRWWCYLYNVFVVMPREEWLVWWFTMSNWWWRLGMVASLAVLTEATVLWVMELTLDVTLTWSLTLGVALVVAWCCSTLLAWRR